MAGEHSYPDPTCIFDKLPNILIYWCVMINEREIIKNIIDFGFLIKSQLHSEDTAMLRSILSIMIMECEDLVEIIEEGHDGLGPAKSRRSEN
ncbi:MAG: hypothetical protein O9322_06235 [Beijerinckiaceae bacterium]|nr:hypothetical protein [Beijerinckiaceae bacterium]MCZ8299121.1 hypothetical protein [Beijerinckiaceae bacterium]